VHAHVLGPWKGCTDIQHHNSIGELGLFLNNAYWCHNTKIYIQNSISTRWIYGYPTIAWHPTIGYCPHAYYCHCSSWSHNLILHFLKWNFITWQKFTKKKKNTSLDWMSLCKWLWWFLPHRIWSLRHHSHLKSRSMLLCLLVFLSTQCLLISHEVVRPTLSMEPGKLNPAAWFCCWSTWLQNEVGSGHHWAQSTIKLTVRFDGLSALTFQPQFIWSHYSWMGWEIGPEWPSTHQCTIQNIPFWDFMDGMKLFPRGQFLWSVVLFFPSDFFFGSWLFFLPGSLLIFFPPTTLDTIIFFLELLPTPPTYLPTYLPPFLLPPSFWSSLFCARTLLDLRHLRHSLPSLVLETLSSIFGAWNSAGPGLGFRALSLQSLRGVKRKKRSLEWPCGRSFIYDKV